MAKALKCSRDVLLASKTGEYQYLTISRGLYSLIDGGDVPLELRVTPEIEELNPR